MGKAPMLKEKSDPTQERISIGNIGTGMIEIRYESSTGRDEQASHDKFLVLDAISPEDARL